jgi:hypothetical protein
MLEEGLIINPTDIRVYAINGHRITIYGRHTLKI